MKGKITLATANVHFQEAKKRESKKKRKIKCLNCISP